MRRAGYEPGKDFVLAMDAASSEWKGERKGEYILPKCGRKFTSAELVDHWKRLAEKYPIYSIEDGPVSYTHLDVYKRQAATWSLCARQPCP